MRGSRAARQDRRRLSTTIPGQRRGPKVRSRFAATYQPCTTPCPGAGRWHLQPKTGERLLASSTFTTTVVSMTTPTPESSGNLRTESHAELEHTPYERPAGTSPRENLGAQRERIVLERPEWIGVITVRKRAE